MAAGRVPKVRSTPRHRSLEATFDRSSGGVVGSRRQAATNSPSDACSLAALGMGSTQAVGRSFMAQITPPSRESEFFGFYVLSGKFASMFGPLVFGLVSEASGSQRLAVLSLLPFFLIGLAIMAAVNVPRAFAQAREAC